MATIGAADGLGLPVSTHYEVFDDLAGVQAFVEHWGEHRGRYWLDAARYADIVSGNVKL